MASAVGIISSLYGIYSSVQQRKDGDRQASKQEELSRQNAANAEAETAEQARRAQLDGDKKLAKGRALAAASGVETGGSMSIFLASEEDELDNELAWLNKSGASQADIIRRGGRNQASVTRSQAKGVGNAGLLKGLGGLASSGSSWASGYQGSNKANKTWFNY